MAMWARNCSIPPVLPLMLPTNSPIRPTVLPCCDTRHTLHLPSTHLHSTESLLSERIHPFPFSYADCFGKRLPTHITPNATSPVMMTVDPTKISLSPRFFGGGGLAANTGATLGP